jgi:hypothetical protein
VLAGVVGDLVALEDRIRGFEGLVGDDVNVVVPDHRMSAAHVLRNRGERGPPLEPRHERTTLYRFIEDDRLEAEKTAVDAAREA